MVKTLANIQYLKPWAFNLLHLEQAASPFRKLQLPFVQPLKSLSCDKFSRGFSAWCSCQQAN